MVRMLIAVLIGAWLATTGLAVLQCTVQAETIPRNIDGDLLVLDVGSISYRGPHPAGPPITDAAQCAAACGQLPACNAWTFCSNPKGCGSGCKAWAAKHPKLPTKGVPSPDPVNVDLPIQGFGSWTFPQTENGCQYSFDSDSTSDAWPFGLCSLKHVKDPKKPQFYAAPAAIVAEAASKASTSEGWISGTYALSADCQGLPANICKQCQKSQHPDKCLKCATDPRAQYSKKPIKYLINKDNNAQSACSICANLNDTALQNRCFECTLSAKACSTCVYGSQMWGYGPPNIGACITCTARKGDMYAGACNACAQSKQPGRCFSCLDTFPLKICGPNQTTGTGGCMIGPNDQTPCDLCSNSAKNDAVFQQCTNCYRNPNWQNECSECGSVPEDAAGQSRCYQCIQNIRSPSYEYYGCSSCFGSLLPKNQHATCLQCVEDRSVSFAAKASCSSCINTTAGLSTKGSGPCFTCLRSQQQDYSSACTSNS